MTHGNMTFVSLFAGIGGFDLGLSQAGWRPTLFCDNNEEAIRVLRDRFPKVPIHDDVRTLREIPRANMVVAGFPCTDISQAGMCKGIKRGKQSSLVKEVFRLLETQDVPWVLLENVPQILSLDRGSSMSLVLNGLTKLGYRWAYRLVDTRAFGLPHRRLRVFFLATKLPGADPAQILLGEDHGDFDESAFEETGSMYGFYWNMGGRGAGWAPEAVPTLIRGSGIRIPTPPGVWDRSTRSFFLPEIEDIERLQGFPAGWTSAADPRYRGSLVGNSVTVPIAEWIGRGIARHMQSRRLEDGVGGVLRPKKTVGSWPGAAYLGRDGRVYTVDVGTMPISESYVPLSAFLEKEGIPMSARQLGGFIRRMSRNGRRVPAAFFWDAERYIEKALRGR